MKIHPVGAELFRVDRQTDVMKLIAAFCNLVNVPRNKTDALWVQKLPCSVTEGLRMCRSILHPLIHVHRMAQGHLYFVSVINPLNPELNPICYLLALLGAHHFLHVSRIRVKSLTFRRLISYIYIWSTHS